jgi:hypothetical protein
MHDKYVRELPRQLSDVFNVLILDFYSKTSIFIECKQKKVGEKNCFFILTKICKKNEF